MGDLCRARLLVSWVPFRLWRERLGPVKAPGRKSEACSSDPRRLAGHVDRAAALLPFATKCLPRAMALSWMLRRQGIPHALVFAVRPAKLRDADGLHAWVEADGAMILGELPGPWVETLRLE
ncbi:MAG: lasso peptide biosynthesis B2 protein [Sphingomicrobium sp.]